MCSHYQAVREAERLKRHFGVSSAATADLASKTDMWPGYSGSFIRAQPHAEVGDEAVPQAEHLPGLFGLVQDWLVAKPEQSMDFMVPFDALALQSSAAAVEHKAHF